jgi:hypothetical protein
MFAADQTYAFAENLEVLLYPPLFLKTLKRFYTVVGLVSVPDPQLDPKPDLEPGPGD